jgi:hypothetical protein
MSELEKITDLFRMLGASDPEQWAASQVEEGINQLGRFLFLRAAWQGVIGEDQAWIELEMSYASQNPDAPCAGGGQSLKRLIERGANPQDLTDLVRAMQVGLLSHLCQILDDAGCVNVEPEIEHISWALIQTNEMDGTEEPIDALHESVLELDPAGREMRPRGQHQ